MIVCKSIDLEGRKRKRALIIFSVATAPSGSSPLPTERKPLIFVPPLCFVFCSLFFLPSSPLHPSSEALSPPRLSRLHLSPFPQPLLPLVPSFLHLLHHVFVRSHRLHELLHVVRGVYVGDVRDGFTGCLVYCLLPTPPLPRKFIAKHYLFLSSLLVCASSRNVTVAMLPCLCTSSVIAAYSTKQN